MGPEKRGRARLTRNPHLVCVTDGTSKDPLLAKEARNGAPPMQYRMWAIGRTVTVMRPALTIIAALIEPRGVWFCRLLVLRLRYSNREAAMAAGFLKQLFEIFCRHRFSWPHSSVHGPDYQICLICGTTYEYDCVTMRRTRRLASALHERAELKSDGRRD